VGTTAQQVRRHTPSSASPPVDKAVAALQRRSEEAAHYLHARWSAVDRLVRSGELDALPGGLRVPVAVVSAASLAGSGGDAATRHLKVSKVPPGNAGGHLTTTSVIAGSSSGGGGYPRAATSHGKPHHSHRPRPPDHRQSGPDYKPY